MTETLDRPNGVVVLTRSQNGKYLVFPNTHDNHNKFERTADMNMRQFNQVEGFQFIGGQIEDGETPEGAAIREAWEEGRIRLRKDQLIETGFGLPVEQVGRGKFGVQVMEVALNSWQELQLRLFKHAKIIDEDNFEKVIIRTRDRAVIKLDMDYRKAPISIGA